jgi:DNA polymerase III epsilon subunit family exonuclease
VKFSTPELAICQWCISEIVNSEPDIPSAIRDILAKAVRGMPAPPSEPNYTRIEQGAIREVRMTETWGRYFVRQIFGVDEQKLALERRVRQTLEAARDWHLREMQQYRGSWSKLLEGRFEALVGVPKNSAESCSLDDMACLIHEFGPLSTRVSEWTIVGSEKSLRILRAFRKGVIGANQCRRIDPVPFQAMRNHVLNRDRWRCSICSKQGRGLELHVHHIIPLDSRGTNNSANLATVCYTCHNRLHDGFTVSKHRKRWIVGGRFVSIDIETTGFSRKGDEIIEVGAARFENGSCVDTYSSLVRPNGSVPEKILRLTGISIEDLERARPSTAVIPEFIRFVGTDKLIGHNLKSFDLPFLCNSCYRIGLSSITNDFVDTLHLCREKVESNDHKLQTMLRRFGIKCKGHRAIEDAKACGELYIELLNHSQATSTRHLGTPPQAKKQKGAVRVPCFNCGLLLEVRPNGPVMLGACGGCTKEVVMRNSPLWIRKRRPGGHDYFVSTDWGEEVGAKAIGLFKGRNGQYWNSFLRYVRQGGPDCTEFQVVRSEDGKRWIIKSPNGVPVARKNTLEAAFDVAIDLETDHLTAQGFPEDIVSCVWTVRRVFNWDPNLSSFGYLDLHESTESR